ncbi:MAG: hypothetical protein U1F68_06080 [Gammaproteobacteria bacterium]
MPCELEVDDVKTFAGLTLYTKRGSSCIKQTAVYRPPNFSKTKKPSVVLWLHGYYVPNHHALFRSDRARVREQVLASNKDVILIAPFLGYKYGLGKDEGTYNGGDLAAAKWGERYLDEVLLALARLDDPTAKRPLDIQNLVIACHSAGGSSMRNLVGTLGKYQANLKECWGFDCLYGASATPDDAVFWATWATGKDGRPLYIVYGPSTLRQSLKLDLIARGIATLEGNKAVPPGPKISNVQVSIAHYETFMAFGQAVKVGNLEAVVDDLITRPPPGSKPGAKPAKPKDGDFVRVAAENLSANFVFVEYNAKTGTGDIHYFIARAFFLSRLRAANFL